MDGWMKAGGWSKKKNGQKKKEQGEKYTLAWLSSPQVGTG
jgi:hypothetical protein